MQVRVATAIGVVRVDLDDGAVASLGEEAEAPMPGDAGVRLPLLIASARCGSRIVAVVARRPPLIISDDVGSTWREVGSGLPRGVDADISQDNPDDVVFASESRIHVSRNGGVFWRALDIELPEITAIAWEPEPDV